MFYLDKWIWVRGESILDHLFTFRLHSTPTEWLRYSKFPSGLGSKKQRRSSKCAKPWSLPTAFLDAIEETQMIKNVKTMKNETRILGNKKKTFYLVEASIIIIIIDGNPSLAPITDTHYYY